MRRNIIDELKTVVVTAMLVAGLFSGAAAQSVEAYQIGAEDVLEIEFWQDENLNAQVRVTLDGKITLDIIGEIDAAGLTTSELERNIVRQMARYNKAVSQAVVRVVAYNHLKVFVSGQVVNPGKYTFEVIPDLWTIVNEAGGITETGDLTRVRIIRGGRDAGKVEEVNVGAMVSGGKIGELPKIRPGDTIEIPRTFSGLPGEAIVATEGRRNVFYVVGEVGTPGVHNLDRSLDLMEAIALAGGPQTTANIKKISVISKDRLGTQVTKFNLKEYAENPSASRYSVQPEDVIFLPQSRTAFLGLGLTEWIAIVGGVGSFVLLAERLNLFGMGDETN